MQCRYWRLPQYVTDQYIQGYYNRRQSQSQVELICSDWWQLPLQTDSPQLLTGFSLLYFAVVVSGQDWLVHSFYNSVSLKVTMCLFSVSSQVRGDGGLYIMHETREGLFGLTRKYMKVYFTVKILLWHHVQSSISLRWAMLLFSDMAQCDFLTDASQLCFCGYCSF